MHTLHIQQEKETGQLLSHNFFNIHIKLYSATLTNKYKNLQNACINFTVDDKLIEVSDIIISVYEYLKEPSNSAHRIVPDLQGRLYNGLCYKNKSNIQTLHK